MTTTKSKTPKPVPQYGDHLTITPYQIKAIMANCAYQVETKNEYVQWVTEDINRISLTSITQAEAVKIIRRQTGQDTVIEQTENYAVFDKENPKHKLILSLCRQANWTVTNVKHGEVADLNRLDKWLKSDRAPVNKALKKMNAQEVQKTIKALGGIVKSIYK